MCSLRPLYPNVLPSVPNWTGETEVHLKKASLDDEILPRMPPAHLKDWIIPRETGGVDTNRPILLDHTDWTEVASLDQNGKRDMKTRTKN